MAQTARPLATGPESELIRAYVWELPVRITHWLTVACVAVLSFTGYYIHNPFLKTATANPYMMADMRFIHVLTGFIFALSFLWRMYWMSRGNYCAAWRIFIPLRKSQWRGMWDMIKYYSFLSWRPSFKVGHNALASVVYLFMFALMLWQILSGFALYGQILRNSAADALFGWLPYMIGVQNVRQFHYFVMFLFFAFSIHHVYSAALVSAEERNGLIESIFTGYKFVPRWSLQGDIPCGAEVRPETKTQGQPVRAKDHS